MYYKHLESLAQLVEQIARFVVLLLWQSARKTVRSFEHRRCATNLKPLDSNMYFKHLEPLAQLVEHLTFNQRVEGSSPSWLTKFLLNNESEFRNFFKRAPWSSG
jgi:hypothetical protein